MNWGRSLLLLVCLSLTGLLSCQQESRKSAPIDIGGQKPPGTAKGGQPVTGGQQQQEEPPPEGSENPPVPTDDTRKDPPEAGQAKTEGEDKDPAGGNQTAGDTKTNSDGDNSSMDSDSSKTTEAVACPAGSVAAVDDLRECCKEKGWGAACGGPCWKEGVPEQLAKLCSAQASQPVNDCGKSPPKSDTEAWCDFHRDRRYCGVSDEDWLSNC